MVDSSDRCQSYKEVDSLFPKFGLVREAIEHLGSTLGVANVSYLRNTCLLSNEVDLCWCIVIAHFGEGEFPVGFVSLIIETFMFHAVLRASLISKPHVIPGSNKLERWRQLRAMHDPAISRVKNSMLHECNRSLLTIVSGSTILDSIHGEDISIFSHDMMQFELEPIVVNDLLQTFFHIRIHLESLALEEVANLRHDEVIRLFHNSVNFLNNMCYETQVLQCHQVHFWLSLNI